MSKIRVKALADKWLKPLGLLWWERIEFVYFGNREHFDRGSRNEGLFITYADWRYLDAVIEVNLPLAAEMSDERLELCFVHEMMHLHLNELEVPGKRKDHEERVAQNLARAFIWVAETTGGDKMIEEKFYTLDEDGNRIEHRYTPVVIENPQGTAEMMQESDNAGQKEE